MRGEGVLGFHLALPLYFGVEAFLFFVFLRLVTIAGGVYLFLKESQVDVVLLEFFLGCVLVRIDETLQRFLNSFLLLHHPVLLHLFQVESLGENEINIDMVIALVECCGAELVLVLFDKLLPPQLS